MQGKGRGRGGGSADAVAVCTAEMMGRGGVTGWRWWDWSELVLRSVWC